MTDMMDFCCDRHVMAITILKARPPPVLTKPMPYLEKSRCMACNRLTISEI